VARFDGGRVTRCEWRFRCKDGTFFIGEVVGRQLPDGRLQGILRDITDRKRAEEALVAAKTVAEQAKASAEQANQAKDHFLAVLSHELRTPLAPMLMGVSILQDDPNLSSRVRETLEMVHRNIEMEARLIEDLLDVARIARGKIELSCKPVDLATIIQCAVEICNADIEARGLDFGVDMGPGAPYWIEADAARLQQVFWNLLKNAIKFTPHGGCVGIRCRSEGTHVAVEVNDSGMGIETEALSRIFNTFEQTERSITRQFGGLGLGLAISKALVEMHGGTIEARSEGRDKGATFCVRLPLAAPAGSLPAGGAPEVASPATVPRRVVCPLRILLVEDHGVTAKLMRMALTVDGHTVESAGDVATALELAELHTFDLLVSDLGLPDGSGHDLMRQLRARGHKFPGIALSGYGQEEDIQRSREAGFAAHLTKPASREAVVEAIAASVAKR
jgi:two-component system CheB/CheR fusion protein